MDSNKITFIYIGEKKTNNPPTHTAFKTGQSCGIRRDKSMEQKSQPRKTKQKQMCAYIHMSAYIYMNLQGKDYKSMGKGRIIQ